MSSLRPPPSKEGTHLTADLAACPADHPWLTDPAALRQACLQAVTASGLQAVGDCFHHFTSVQAGRSRADVEDTPGSTGGVTGVVLLAESHLAVHTWPEHGVVTLDVFVCNMLGDNTSRARHLLDALITGFAPGRQSVHAIRRRIPAADKT